MGIKSGYEQLIWGNSIEDVKKYYPNITERSSIGSHRIFYEVINEGIASSRVFKFYEEKLYLVQVIFDEEQLNSAIINAFYEDLQEKYGKFNIDETEHYEGDDDFYETARYCKKKYASDFEITLFYYYLRRNGEILSNGLEIVYKDPNVFIEDQNVKIISYSEWRKLVEADNSVCTSRLPTVIRKALSSELATEIYVCGSTILCKS